MITQEKHPTKPVWTIKLDKKTIGEIRQLDTGFKYFPKGDKVGGALFTSMNTCFNSLITEEDGPFPGQLGTTSGFECTVLKQYSEGMIEVRVPGGISCIPVTDFIPA